MNKRTLKGLVAVVALSSASMVNAATVSLIPASPTVSNIGDTVTLTVQGTEFTNGVSLGSIGITWDQSFLQLNTNLATIEAATLAAGFNDVSWNTFNSVAAGAADITFGHTFPDSVAGPTINFFTLEFTTLTALPANPANVIVAAIGSGGGFLESDHFTPYVMNFNNATVSAVPVPAAVWLFGSGLIGLAGIARRSATIPAA